MTTDLVRTIPLDGLPASATDEQKLTIEALISRITAVPEGFEGDYHWRPSRLKLTHGTTSDPLKPDDAHIGDFYADGEIVYKTKTKKGWPFIPLRVWTAHALWPAVGQAPTCQSDDGVWSRDGLKCNDCPHFPGINGGCTRSTEAIVLGYDLVGMFHVSFAKSSSPGGTNLKKFMQLPTAAGSLVALLHSEERKNTEKNSVYYVSAVSRGSTQDYPRGEVHNFVAAQLREFIGAWRTDLMDRQAQQRNSANAVFSDDAIDVDGQKAQPQLLPPTQDDGFSSDM